jgi:hypothetical protein
MSVPKGVIREYEPSYRHQRIDQIEVGTVLTLVGVNEDQVFMSFESFYDKIFLPLSTSNRNLAFDVIVRVRKKK